MTIFASVHTARAAEIDIGVFGGFRGFGEEAGTLVLDDRFMFGLRAGVAFGPLGIEAEGAFIPTHVRTASDSVSGLAIRGHLRYIFNREGFARPFVALGFGIFNRSYDDPPVQLPRGKSTTEGYLGAGFDLFFTKVFEVRIDGRAYWPTKEDFGFNQFNWEVLLTLGFAFNRPTAAVALPPPPADADGDGVPDDQDKCPTEAGPADRGGCPVKDSDNDGIPDDQDKCPNEAGPADRGGCPVKDSDNDGIPDDQDKCPNEAGPADRQGCPAKDTDGDGILDENDKCPDQPETKNGFEDEDGCPDEIPAAVKKFTGVIKGINFVTGKSTITKGSFKTLDQAVAVLKEYASVKIEISGHTDDTGKRDKNMQLSQDRADAVKAYFVSKGVDESRIRTVGNGPDKPLVPGKSAKARAANRRVEFNIITQ